MAKAIYYNVLKEGKEFDVIGKNPDGTLNIGIGKELVVGSVRVVKDPEDGCVTLVDEPKPEPKSAEPKK